MKAIKEIIFCIHHDNIQRKKVLRIQNNLTASSTGAVPRPMLQNSPASVEMAYKREGTSLNVGWGSICTKTVACLPTECREDLHNIELHAHTQEDTKL